MKVESFFSLGKLRLAAVLTGVAAFCGAAAWGQMPGAGGGTASAAMLKLFGTNDAFSARAEFQILGKDHKEIGSTALGFALLDGMTRMEIDVRQMKGRAIPPTFVSTMTQLGLDQTIVVTRPDKKTVLSVFPRAKAYAEIPMTVDEAAAAARTFTMDRTASGKETIGGHPCDKSHVLLTDNKGEKTEATVWNATDLNNFPVQIEMPADAVNSMVIRFTDVKLGRPEAKLFEAPAGMTKYKSADELTDAMVKAKGATNSIK